MGSNMSVERPILIVDDDSSLRETLSQQFAADAEFTTTGAATLVEAEARLSARGARFDAVILDVRLPDGDGRDLCIRMRQQGQAIPIIMLSGFCAEADVVRGLDAGANDYIAKPFRFAELLARVRAQLRAFDDSNDAVLSIGNYTFRPAAKSLEDPGKNQRIRLTTKETALLKILYRARSRTVTHEALMRDVWGYGTTVASHTLQTHIYRLRQKMEANPVSPCLLITENHGYRLDLGGLLLRQGTAKWMTHAL